MKPEPRGLVDCFIESWGLPYTYGAAVRCIVKAHRASTQVARQQWLEAARLYLGTPEDVKAVNQRLATTDDVKCEGPGASSGTRKT